jgi:hypothetical protein
MRAENPHYGAHPQPVRPPDLGEEASAVAFVQVVRRQAVKTS